MSYRTPVALLMTLLFWAGCDTAPVETTSILEGRIQLENLSDHSGVTVRLISDEGFSQQFVTGESGAFEFEEAYSDSLTLIARYPYFRPETLEVTEAMYTGSPLDVELQQLLRIELAPSSTEDTLDIDNEVAVFQVTTINLTSDTIRLSGAAGTPERPTYSFLALVPAEGELPDDPECQVYMGFAYDYDAAQTAQPAEYYPSAEQSSMGGFTSENFDEHKYMNADCLTPGNYLLYASWPDQYVYPNYFIGDQTILDPSASSYERQRQRQLSLLRKPNLINPIPVYLQ